MNKAKITVTCKANKRIRLALQNSKVPVWMLADRYGKSENTMYRLFRHELDSTEQDRIIAMIKEIAQERELYGSE